MGCSNSTPAHRVAPTASNEIVALTAAQLEDPIERYSKTTVLRALLTHDPALGGVAIKLVSVRWLITYFQDNPSARLEHRQHLERTTPEAFVTGAMLERVLAELASGEYMTEVGGEYKSVTMRTNNYDPVEIAFPSAAAMSHMCAASRIPRTRAQCKQGNASAAALTPPSSNLRFSQVALRWSS